MRTELDIPTGQPQHFLFKRLVDELLHFHGLANQATDQKHGFFLAHIGKKTVITDFREPSRQDMEQEPADKFHCVKSHRPGRIVVGPVFVA